MVWQTNCSQPYLSRLPCSSAAYLKLWHRGGPLTKKGVMLDKQYDNVRWKTCNWGHWLLDGHDDRLFLQGRCFCKIRCFYWVQGSAIQPVDSCVMKWGIQSPKHNPRTSRCSSRSGGGWFFRKEELMYVVVQCSVQHETTHKTYLQLFWRVVSCFMVCPFGANKNMQSTWLHK